MQVKTLFAVQNLNFQIQKKNINKLSFSLK